MNAYVLAAIALVGGLLGAGVAHLIDKGRYDHLQIEFANYKASEAAQKAIDQAAARVVLQQQIDNAQKVFKENDSVIADLHAKLAAADAQRASDRATVSRMFHQAAACSASGGDVPKASGVSGTADPGGPPSLDQLAGACEALADEDRHNANAKDALAHEIQPQL